MLPWPASGVQPGEALPASHILYLTTSPASGAATTILSPRSGLLRVPAFQSCYNWVCCEVGQCEGFGATRSAGSSNHRGCHMRGASPAFGNLAARGPWKGAAPHLRQCTPPLPSDNPVVLQLLCPRAAIEHWSGSRHSRGNQLQSRSY